MPCFDDVDAAAVFALEETRVTRLPAGCRIKAGLIELDAAAIRIAVTRASQVER